MDTSPDLTTFVAMSILLVLAPGQDTLLTLRNASRSGFRAGLETSFGICCGLFVHALVSAAGLSAILVSSASAFELLRIAGATYLAWLAIESFLQARDALLDEPRAPTHSGAGRPNAPRVAFRQGFLSNVLNPKTAAFYLAIFPQFVRSPETAILDSIFLAAVHFFISIVWLSVLAGLASSARDALSRPRVSALFHTLAGIGLAAFAGLLFWDRPSNP